MRKLCVPLRTTQPPASAQSLPSPLVLPFTLRSRERIRGRATGTNPPWAPAAVVAQRQVQPRRGLSTRKTLSNPRTHTAALPSCFLNCPRGPTAPAPHAGARLLPQVEKLFLLLHPTVGRAKTMHAAAGLQLPWPPPVLHRPVRHSPSLRHQLFLSSLEQQLVAYTLPLPSSQAPSAAPVDPPPSLVSYVTSKTNRKADN